MTGSDALGQKTTMPITLVPGVGRPQTMAEVEETSAPAVVPNYNPPENNVSPKLLPPVRLIESQPDVTRLLGKVLEASPLTVKQIADAIGVKPQTIYNAKKGRSKMSLAWFLRLCNVCGARLYISLPQAKQ